MYFEPPLILCSGSNLFLTPTIAAVSSVTIIMPLTPILDLALGSHCDSWNEIAASNSHSKLLSSPAFLNKSS